MSDTVSFEKRDSIGVIRVANPPVNALSHSVRQGIVQAVNDATADDEVAACVLICDGRTFIAGADITEFNKRLAEPSLHDVINTLEGCSKPVIAALHGTALGGGFEVALACHYRCAVPSGKVGLPEVHLGLLPGAGGTQRLPRVVGAQIALEMILSGKPIPAGRASELGIVDRIIEGDLEEGALAYANELADSNAPLKKISELTVDPETATDEVFAATRAGIAKKARGFFAPERCIQAVEAAVNLPFAEGMTREAELFMECMQSTESAAQRHVFFGERAVAKIPDVPKDTPIRDIKKVGIIGAGTMGGGIAMNFANAGIPVVIKEVEQEPLDRGLGVIEKNYRRTAAKGRITETDVDKRMTLLTGTLDYADLADADLVIEAVFENMDIKKEVFKTLDEVCKPGAILATNTSTLDVDEIAAVTGRPEDVIGLHFFSPANVMRLLEIVRGEKTAKDVVATAMKMSKGIRKVGVLSGVCYGFIGNRMLEGYGREAGMLILEGAEPAQVDKAIYDFGFPMGPLAMSDLAGVDVGYKVRQERRDSLPDDERYALVSDKLAEMGRYGQKTGAGFYKYEAGSRMPIPDPDVQELIETEAKRLGIERREISEEEIVERCVYPLINEGARILEEGIALRPVDIDIVWIMGYGFPAYRGGPMFYADTVGVKNVYDKIVEFGETLGNEHGYWEPAPLLKQLAESGGKFGDLK